jgi:tetratricopeptide (TPR) repeat protein
VLLPTILILGQLAASAPSSADALKRANEAATTGHLQEAIELYRDAYRSVPSPNILYNLGQVLREVGRKREALDAFRRFVAEVEGSDRDVLEKVPRARAWVTELELELGQDPPAPLAHAAGPTPALPRPDGAISIRAQSLTMASAGVLPPATIAAAPPAPAPLRRAWKWWLLGAGLAVAAVATVVVVSGLHRGCPGGADLGCL